MKKRIIAISYGDSNYSMSRKLNLWTAKHFGGADETIAYGPSDLDDDFCYKNKMILSQPRGGGYWIWKPYIIRKTIDKVNVGEYIFYTDAGMIYSHNVRCLIDIMEEDGQDICLSSGIAPAKHWCKRDCFILMNCDCIDAYNQVMVSGGYILIKKSEFSISFIDSWLKYAQDKRILTDIPNELGFPNLEGFVEHRHDQAILTNLSYLNGIYAYKAMSHVDEPRAHRLARKGIVGAYKYSFEERLELIKKEHMTIGYQRSKYPRLFINTRIKNCNCVLFFSKVIKNCINAFVTDIWGWIYDDRYLKRKK